MGSTAIAIPTPRRGLGRNLNWFGTSGSMCIREPIPCPV